MFAFIDWEHILDKWGWPTLILFVVCGALTWLVKTVAVPQIEAYVTRTRALADDARAQLKEHTAKLEQTQDTILVGFTTTLDGFKDVLDANSRRTEKQIDMLTEILTEVKMNGRLLSSKERA